MGKELDEQHQFKSCLTSNMQGRGADAAGDLLFAIL